MATESILETGRPSASTVLQKLVADSEAERLRRAGPLVALPPASLLTRLLIWSCAGLLGFTTWCVLSVTGHASLLAEGIRNRQQAERSAQRTLPAGEDLLAPELMAEALRQHPLHAGTLHQRRGMALARSGQPDAAINAFQQAKLTALTNLPPAVEMTWAECLADLGRWQNARDHLLAGDLRGWNTTDRRRAAVLLSQAWQRSPGAPARDPAGRSSRHQTDGRPDS